jgi:hypothetical protein
MPIGEAREDCADAPGVQFDPQVYDALERVLT